MDFSNAEGDIMAFFSIYRLPNGDVEISARPGGGGDRGYMPRQKINPPADGMIFGITFEEFAALTYCVTDAEGGIIEKGERYTGLPQPDDVELPAWVRKHNQKQLDE